MSADALPDLAVCAPPLEGETAADKSCQATARRGDFISPVCAAGHVLHGHAAPAQGEAVLRAGASAEWAVGGGGRGACVAVHRAKSAGGRATLSADAARTAAFGG